jgi:hypothetical protein
MNTKYLCLQFTLGIIFGSIIACSPTKFSEVPASGICNNSVSSCAITSGFVDVTQNYKVGSGKVDILFVSDNSASMSKAQVQLATKFSGFIQNLDSKSIDYRISITTTDLNYANQKGLITFANGKKFISNIDTNRVSLFNNAIIRNETIACEDFIIGMFNTYGPAFQSMTQYASQYYSKCPSSDTRGINTANVIVSSNYGSFMRDDASLNVILISNDNVRQGAVMENNDRASTFISMMEAKYPTKYWDFNSIVVKDNTCKSSQTLRNKSNQVVSNQSGPAISAGIGIEYANLSNSAARDIDNNPRPRGQILDICESNYSQHFNTMSTQISDEARMFTMNCVPTVAPVVSPNIQHTWSGNKIIFSRGNEGTSVSVSYRCYTGPT